MVPGFIRWMRQSTMLTAWEMVVASAADQTPQWKPPMNSRSSAMFTSEERMR